MTVNADAGQRIAVLPPDFIAELRAQTDGEVRADTAARVLYSTDASIYQILPLGVFFPRGRDDLQACVTLAAKHGIPILPRGSGTSLAGQAVGPALILDCSRWLNQIVDVDRESLTAVAEAGVLLSNLNRVAARHGLQFGPDPASAERATVGGIIGNNASGAHSIMYGMTADHLENVDAILSDGSLATFGEIDAFGGIDREAASLYAALLNQAREIVATHGDRIRGRYPATWRNSAGYRLNYLLPWSPARPPEWSGGPYPPAARHKINMASLLAGSEGTLAVVRSATLRLVRKPPCTALAVLTYESNAAACDAVPHLLREHPSAIELIPRLLIRLAKARPGYAAQLGWAASDPAALLVIEFSGERQDEVLRLARRIAPGGYIAETAVQQADVWAIRRLGLGILDSRPVAARPVAFIEDCAIPVEHLGAFVREVEHILSDHKVEGGIYAHASAGCLHIRPILDLGAERGRKSLRSIAEQTLEAALGAGGSMSSEHGDGVARGEWLLKTYGAELVDAMRALKQAADPRGLLNPGKMFDAPPMDSNLRTRRGEGWTSPSGRFAELFARDGIQVGIEQCNGQGLCRKESGLMCPSYQATRDEMHSTRGRANLLRALMLGVPAVPHANGEPMAPGGGEAQGVQSEAVWQALDLCLACQGCRAECPSGVDMPKLKAAFQDAYYRTRRRPLRDYLFGYVDVTATLMAALPFIGTLAKGGWPARMAKGLLGLAYQRDLPSFSRRGQVHLPLGHGGRAADYVADVIFLPEAFGRYVNGEGEEDAVRLLDALGFRVHMLPILGAGAAFMSKGFVAAAQRRATRVLAALRRIDPSGSMPVVGIEPAEVYAIRHDYQAWLPDRTEEVQAQAANVWLLEEFLLRAGPLVKARLQTGAVPADDRRVLFHPHCHQQAQAPAPDGLPYGSAASLEALRASGFEPEQTPEGCCGMAGTFGFEAEHYQLSMKVGELSLFPTLRHAVPGTLVAASGAACRMHISHATGLRAVHPVTLIRRCLNPKQDRAV